jgi:hypothetical protein
MSSLEKRNLEILENQITHDRNLMRYMDTIISMLQNREKHIIQDIEREKTAESNIMEKIELLTGKITSLEKHLLNQKNKELQDDVFEKITNPEIELFGKNYNSPAQTYNKGENQQIINSIGSNCEDAFDSPYENLLEMELDGMKGLIGESKFCIENKIEALRDDLEINQKQSSDSISDNHSKAIMKFSRIEALLHTIIDKQGSNDLELQRIESSIRLIKNNSSNKNNTPSLLCNCKCNINPEVRSDMDSTSTKENTITENQLKKQTKSNRPSENKVHKNEIEGKKHPNKVVAPELKNPNESYASITRKNIIYENVVIKDITKNKNSTNNNNFFDNNQKNTNNKKINKMESASNSLPLISLRVQYEKTPVKDIAKKLHNDGINTNKIAYMHFISVSTLEILTYCDYAKNIVHYLEDKKINFKLVNDLTSLRDPNLTNEKKLKIRKRMINVFSYITDKLQEEKIKKSSSFFKLTAVRNHIYKSYWNKFNSSIFEDTALLQQDNIKNQQLSRVNPNSSPKTAQDRTNPTPSTPSLEQLRVVGDGENSQPKLKSKIYYHD